MLGYFGSTQHYLVPNPTIHIVENLQFLPEIDNWQWYTDPIYYKEGSYIFSISNFSYIDCRVMFDYFDFLKLY